MGGRMRAKTLLVEALILTLVVPSLAWGAKSAKSYLAEGKKLSAKGQYNQAITSYTLAIKRSPKLAEAYLLRGEAYGRKAKPDLNLAIADFSKVITLKPRSALGYQNRGVAYAQKGQFDKALADLNKAIKLNPKFGQAYVTRAMVYRDKKDYAKALKDVKKAQKLRAKVPPGLVKELEQTAGKTK